MLISQRIAKDVNFLAKIGPVYTTPFFDVRMRIINATKIISTHEFLNFDTNYAENLTQVMANSASSTLGEKGELLRQYAKMPFPSMFIENDTGGLLVEQTKAGFSIIAVSKTGDIHPYTTVFSGFPEGSSIPLPTIEWHVQPGREVTDVMKMAGKVSSLVHVYTAMDVMLFMNVKNITVHQYIPNKKENSMVPRPLLPKYVYRVLDVFRDVTRYESLEQIEGQLAITAVASADRKAHLVKGHFKEFKEGLFGNPKLAGLYWWNMFRRSRKNRDTVGEVEKDYCLKEA